MAYVNQIMEKQGAKGKFYRVNIDDVWYSAFYPVAKDCDGLNKGDQVEFSSAKNGDFNNLKSIKKVGSTVAVGASVPQQPSNSPRGNDYGRPKRDPSEFNHMMATRYALDLLIAGKTPSIQGAVDIVFAAYNEIKRRLKMAENEVAVSPEGDRLKELLSVHLIENNINEGGAPWKEYWTRRFGAKAPSVTELKTVIEDFDKVKAGTMEILLTTDGKLYMKPKS